MTPVLVEVVVAEEDEWDKFLSDLDAGLASITKKPKKTMSRQEELEQFYVADQLRRKYMLPSDEDFSDVLGTYMAGDIDSSIARHLALPELPDVARVALRGVYNHSDDVIEERYDYQGIPIELSYEPGSVNTIHKWNIPSTWSHEYRHKNYPELTEKENRFVDLVAAQSEYDVDKGIRNYAHRLRSGTPSESLEKITHTLRNADIWSSYPRLSDVAVPVIEKETGREYQDVVEDSAIRKFLQEAESLEEWNEGLSKRNKKRAAGDPESLIDAIRAAYEKLGL